MKREKIELKTERMKDFGPYLVDGYEVNYLYGLNDLCEKYVKESYSVLELGSNRGVSTSLFAYFAKNVTAVDLNFTEDMKQLVLSTHNINFHHTSFQSFLELDQDTKYDLIYIDGAHDYHNVKKDIINFLPKVKKGGYLTGHDYNSADYGVIQAVNELFPQSNIEVFADSSWVIKID
jgi:hypothetical protein